MLGQFLLLCLPMLAFAGVREQAEINVEGEPESWRLEWVGEPKPVCSATEPDSALTCPCMGFA